MKTLTIINTILIIWILIAPYRQKFYFTIDRSTWARTPYAVVLWKRISYNCAIGIFTFKWRNPDNIKDKPY